MCDLLCVMCCVHLVIGGQKRDFGTLELELEVITSSLTQVLGSGQEALQTTEQSPAL